MAASSPRVALVVAYDGTAFAGWQSQAGQRTVQGELERALSLVSGEHRVVVEGSGRTDAGVHALAQVAHADLPALPEHLRHRLNGILPEDLRARGLAVVEESFHARKSAVGKLYRYRFDLGAVASPFTSRWSWHVGTRLDVDGMRRAARRFEGDRDFASLQTTGSSAETTRRHVRRCELLDDESGTSLLVEGSGFLRHMVRAIAGCLVEVGRGRRAPEWIDEVLEARDRAAAGPNAPARGLVLERVEYPERFQRALDASVQAGDDA